MSLDGGGGGGWGEKLESIQTQHRKDVVGALSVFWFCLFLLKVNSDAHAHKLEDNLAEANARLAEMERTQTELNTAKIHLTGKTNFT